ncbi:hypothetical protein ACXWTF_05270 [Thiomicrolovo sp. ZZH C-3]
MPAKQYQYAISVVAMKDASVNNQLVSGLADKRHIIEAVNAIGWQFDAAYSEHIVMVTCNVGEERAGGVLYRFTITYPQERVQKCVSDLVSKCEELLE